MILTSGKNRIPQYFKRDLRHDLVAGLSVFFVALPLCLGIALTSGAPLFSGIWSGVIGGLLVSLISGSSLAVSGPAAGLSSVVSAAILSSGNYQVFLLSVMIAGGLQVLLGIFKWGSVANYFPSSVIKGILAAIGLILISKQIPILLGFDQKDFWTGAVTKLFTSSNFTEGFGAFSEHTSRGAILVSTLSLLVYFVIKFSSKSIGKYIPAALWVVLSGACLAMSLLSFSPDLSLTESQFVNIPSSLMSTITFPDFSGLFKNFSIWKNGVIIGGLASLETLLSVEAVDKLDKHNRITPMNRELIAQGVGNITCGLLGAIPITSVIVRGSANVDAGAKTKLSAFFHGAFLLIAVLFAPFLLNKIPYASLAVILLFTGYNLTKPALYVNVWNLGLKQFLPFIITVFFIVATDLLVGVGVGLLVSTYFIIQNNFRAEYKISVSKKLGIDTYYIKLNTNVTFLNKVKLRKALDQIPEYSSLVIDGGECNFIDYDILEVISAFNNKARDRHIEVELIGIKPVQLTSLH